MGWGTWNPWQRQVRSTCWSEDKGTTTLQKKRRATLFNLRFQKHTEKIRHFFTFVSLFIFGFPLRFSPKKITQLKILILNFCPWIPGIFLCNFQPLLPSWPMDKGTPCCTVSKNQQIAVISDRARQSRPKIGLTRCAYWKWCRLNHPGVAYVFSALNLQYLIPCVCNSSVNRRAQSRHIKTYIFNFCSYKEKTL